MKMAIPIECQSMNSNIYPSFGRAPHFLFHDTVTKETYLLDNTAVATQGGAGIRAAQVIADHGVNALIVPRCGENAEELLRKSSVFIYKSLIGSPQKNIDAFSQDKLSILTEIHSGFHDQG